MVGGEHKNAGFSLSFGAKRQVDSHLVAVEVSVVGGTGERVKFNRAPFGEHWFKSLNAEAVQSWRAVQKHGVFLDNFFEDSPDFRRCAFDLTFRGFNRGVVIGGKFFHNEGLEEFERHFFRKTALVQFEFGTDDDNPACP